MHRPPRLLGRFLLFALLLPAPAMADRLDDLAAEVLQLREEMDRIQGEETLGGVRVNGYYAFDIMADSGPGRNTFRQHSFNLFVGKEWDRWQVLSELEFEDGAEIEADATSATGVGAIVLEAAWFQYRFNDGFKVRGGKLLVPEYWTEHHFAPVTMSVADPLIYKKVFPANATGLMLHGSVYSGKGGISYQGWISNGDHHAATDTDDDKGGGGKLTLHMGGLFSATGRLDISFLGFHTLHDYPPAAPSGLEPVDIIGGELQFNTRRFELLAEYARQDGANGPEGFHLQPAVRLSKEVRAYYRFEGLDEGLTTGLDAGMRTRHTGGFNWRPQPNITVKLEGNNTRYDDTARSTVQQLLASVALFF